MSSPETQEWITIDEVWFAYRKAKQHAYYDSNCAHGLKFAEFEQRLVNNLANLHRDLNNQVPQWSKTVEALGRRVLVPKSITPPQALEVQHFREADSWKEWERIHRTGSKSTAEVRIALEATVPFLVISTLWVLKVGEKLDRILDHTTVYANRPRRRYKKPKPGAPETYGPINWEAHSIFYSWQWKYGRWREDGLRQTRKALERESQLIAISLDISSFFDNVDPGFLLSNTFLNYSGVKLSPEEVQLTNDLIKAQRKWRSKYGRYADRGIPIGLPSSGLIANLLLAEFDEQVKSNLKPVFYGRYVDDIYLCVESPIEFQSSEAVLRWLASKVPCLSFRGGSLRIRPAYSPRSKIVFGTRKQRVFSLSGQAGLDVIRPIEEHMRRQTSAHRLLPQLPKTESEMVERALLVTKDAGLATAVIREADVVSLQKWGFAELLRDAEHLSRLLPASEWKDRRSELYGLVSRHLLVPVPFFDFFSYIPRVIGLMAKCEDWQDLSEALSQMRDLRNLLAKTTTISTSDNREMFTCIAKRVELATLKGLFGKSGTSMELAVRALKRIRGFGQLNTSGLNAKRLRQYAVRLHQSDWSRDPFYQVLLGYGARSKKFPSLPSQIKKSMNVAVINECLKEMGLGKAFVEDTWRGILFPTRTIPLSEITQRIGWRNCVGCEDDTVVDQWRLYNFVVALRGVRITPWYRPKPLIEVGGRPSGIRVRKREVTPVRIAVANYKTDLLAWKGAAKLEPVLTLERLDQLLGFINQVISLRPKPHYLVMPEGCIPRSFASLIERMLSLNGISFIAGLEYGKVPGSYNGRLNQALISISLGGQGGLSLLQTKNAPAWVEAEELKKAKAVMLRGDLGRNGPDLPLYVCDGFAFSALICSDLTDCQLRSALRGRVDAVFVVEWNQDLNSFSSLIEASSLDIHAYIVQANNREYGDSRIRGPLREPFKRDIVQVKGGCHDYFVTGEIDPVALRAFQSTFAPNLDDETFKPFPIGYRIAAFRKLNVPIDIETGRDVPEEGEPDDPDLDGVDFLIS